MAYFSSNEYQPTVSLQDVILDGRSLTIEDVARIARNVTICRTGLADLATELGTEARSEGDRWYFSTPYENLAGFQKSSLIVYIKNAKTPTLILQGEEDTNDPISQSQILCRGLKRYNVPSVFVVYPREPHGLREQKHIIDRYRRSVEFVDKYLK